MVPLTSTNIDLLCRDIIKWLEVIMVIHLHRLLGMKQLDKLLPYHIMDGKFFT